MNAFGENAFFAKTWKISILLKENQYFQGFEDNTNAKTMVKNLEKIDVFWDFVFGGILGGFWEAKNLNFRIFVRCFFEVIFQARFEEAKNQPK